MSATRRPPTPAERRVLKRAIARLCMLGSYLIAMILAALYATGQGGQGLALLAVIIMLGAIGIAVVDGQGDD